MLMVQEGGLVAPRGPVEAVGRAPALLRRHAAQQCELFLAGLLVGQHSLNVPQCFYPSKLFAFAKASSTFAASLPPPRAWSGLPPPLPPTMGAMA